jgi:hypothetical protein
MVTSTQQKADLTMQVAVYNERIHFFTASNNPEMVRKFTIFRDQSQKILDALPKN